MGSRLRLSLAMYSIAEHKLKDINPKKTPLPEECEWRSKEDRRYNCFAWAAGFDQFIWDPRALDLPNSSRIRWPTKSDSLSIGNLIEAYRTIGFQICDNGELVEGVEKIALFCDADKRMAHACWQRET